MKRKPLLLFDVNETLLDLSPLKNKINSALENEQASSVWFSKLLHYSLVETLCDQYHDFSKIGIAVFEMIQENFGKSYDHNQIVEILSPISKLPPHEDVPAALQDLNERSFELVAFSNGKPDVLNDQLNNADISKYFHKIISVEGCKKYKPHADTYHYAMEMAGRRDKENTYMVAAHGWDIAGAANAGLKTIFVERKNKRIYPLASKPIHSIKDLTEIKDLL